MFKSGEWRFKTCILAKFQLSSLNSDGLGHVFDIFSRKFRKITENSSANFRYFQNQVCRSMMIQLAKHVYAKFQLSSFYPDSRRTNFRHFSQKIQNFWGNPKAPKAKVKGLNWKKSSTTLKKPCRGFYVSQNILPTFFEIDQIQNIIGFGNWSRVCRLHIPHTFFRNRLSTLFSFSRRTILSNSKIRVLGFRFWYGNNTAMRIVTVRKQNNSTSVQHFSHQSLAPFSGERMQLLIQEIAGRPR
jgi:hypothetical protein